MPCWELRQTLSRSLLETVSRVPPLLCAIRAAPVHWLACLLLLPAHFTWVCGTLLPLHPMQTTRGDMWVTFTVAFPKVISEEQKEQLRKLFGSDAEWQRQQHDEL